ncbi:MAG TPA: FeoA family protein [Vicinamibacteria bacterium]|jgi:Fe2+ transport system protein FeoA
MTTVCALCGLRFEPGGTACADRGCPWAGGRCRFLDCPRCGYAVPDERASGLARWIRRILGRSAPPTPGDPTVADLRRGGEGVVGRISGDEALVARLAAQGLVPGTPLRLVERRPAYVVEIGETTLAFERRVARQIGLAPSPQAGRPLAITLSISSTKTSTSSSVV